jgi:hypothetical protein
MRDALEKLVQFYDAWGKPDEATKWRKEMEATRVAVDLQGPRDP